jgi:hypothetical protein
LPSRRCLGVRALAIALVAAVGGCATNPLPDDRPVSQERAITSGRGAYALAFMSQGGALTGELIAFGDRGVLILGEDHTLRTLELGSLHELRLGVHDNMKGGFIAWMALGALSTASHGLWLIFSAPSWLVAGSLATSNESQRGVFDCPPHEGTTHPDAACLELAARFARFPQGLPPGVDEAKLLGRAPVIAPPAPPAAPSPPTPGTPAAPTPPPFPAPYDPGA